MIMKTRTLYPGPNVTQARCLLKLNIWKRSHLKPVINQAALLTSHPKTMDLLFQAFHFLTSSAFKIIQTRDKSSKKRRKKLSSKNGSSSETPPIGFSTKNPHDPTPRKSRHQTPKNRRHSTGGKKALKVTISPRRWRFRTMITSAKACPMTLRMDSLNLVSIKNTTK